MPNRKPTRLKHYDYFEPGYYFVTICTQNRKEYFGKIVVGDGPCAVPKMELNAIGLMIQQTWMEISKYYPDVEIDTFVVMPNHIHGIVILSGRPRGDAPTLSLSDVVHRFKSLTTAKYRQGVCNYNWPPFIKKFWQRSFYDHVIRNEESLFQIRQYIYDNPLSLHLDRNYPENL